MYVTFLINSKGWIFKVKGNAPKDSKWDNKKYIVLAAADGSEGRFGLFLN